MTFQHLFGFSLFHNQIKNERVVTNDKRIHHSVLDKQVHQTKGSVFLDSRQVVKYLLILKCIKLSTDGII